LRDDAGMGVTERRRSPRVEIAVACTLRRRSGSAISARTLDVGPGGMRIAATRPLATDEVLDFDLPLRDEIRVDGRARVLREQGYRVYALRFEGLRDPARERLGDLVTAG
jgi:PilZ domain